MSLEMIFVVTHLLMDIIASKLQSCYFVLKTEHVYRCLDDFNCDYKFETNSIYLLIYMHEKVLEMENHWTVSPLWKKQFSRGQESA